MENKIKELTEIKLRFQPHIPNQNQIYTYIAPKKKQAYDKFMAIAYEQPTYSATIFEVLNNSAVVSKILLNSFPENTGLEIYVATNDTYSSIIINGTLKEYIEGEEIQFIY